MDKTLLIISLISSVLIGGLCSYVAKEKKDRGPILWFWMGFLFGILALIALYLLPSNKKKPILKESTSLEKNLTLSTQDILLPPPIRKPSGYWFYVNKNKEQVGPLNFYALQQAFLNGELSSDSYVWNDKLTEWKKLNDLKEDLEAILNK